ncbi:modular serine protease-like isoform X2 [Eurosta solidaginis]|uniref:modular serine protease-like isoform X2 n=1 Tax=Eurosta solidaginis TaxID=178769 RepID=UPI0035308FDE
MFKLILVIFLINFGIHRIRCASLEYDDYEDYFTCKNGESISEYQVCNGHKDCTDASDEFEADNIISSPCLKAHCPDADAKCYYGACIPYGRWCNGIRDCADGSDEWKYFCSKSENPNELSCESGEFLYKDFFCDGKKDCKDGSDESSILCSLRRCGTAQFRCRYGGCIDSDKKCNRRKDCHDGSDEDEFHAGCMLESSNRISTPTIDGCTIPYDKNHIIYNDNDNVYIESGYSVQKDTRIFIKCKNNYSLWASTDEVVRICGENNRWDADIPRCYKFCDTNILTRSISTKVDCKYHTAPVLCKRIIPNMIAEVSCADSYENTVSRESTISMRCTSSFSWDRRKINCQPICGKTETLSDPTASDSPWHVGIYAQSIKACGGTIISPRLVISALHCVWDENEEVLPVRLVQVLVAGDSRNGSIESFMKNVSRIIADRSTDSDVALLKLDIPLILSKNIRPICTTFSSADISTGESGSVNGWPRRRRQNKDSLFTKTMIKTITRNDCVTKLRDVQFCVRPSDRMIQNSHNTGELCHGDSGGGIVVHRNDKFYLIGIISFKPSLAFECTTTEPVVATDFIKIPQMLKDVIERDVESQYDD